MRLEEISTLVTEMAKEREKLTADIKAPPGPDGASLKTLRLRRAYVAQRLAIIRKEQADLNVEKKGNGSAKRQRSGASVESTTPKPQ